MRGPDTRPREIRKNRSLARERARYREREKRDRSAAR